jgi:hypothetical protein
LKFATGYFPAEILALAGYEFLPYSGADSDGLIVYRHIQTVLADAGQSGLNIYPGVSIEDIHLGNRFLESGRKIPIQ